VDPFRFAVMSRRIIRSLAGTSPTPTPPFSELFFSRSAHMRTTSNFPTAPSASL